MKRLLLLLCALSSMTQITQTASYAYRAMNTLRWGLISGPFVAAGMRNMLDLEDRPTYHDETARQEFDANIEQLGQEDDAARRQWRIERLERLAHEKHNVKFWQTATLFGIPAGYMSLAALNHVAWPTPAAQQTFWHALLRLPSAGARLIGGALILAGVNGVLQQNVNQEFTRLSPGDQVYAHNLYKQKAHLYKTEFEQGGILSCLHNRMLPIATSILPTDMRTKLDTKVQEHITNMQTSQAASLNQSFVHWCYEHPVSLWAVAPKVMKYEHRAAILQQQNDSL